MHKFDRVTVQNYLVEDNFDITLNLASLIEIVGVKSASAIITRVPEHVATLMNWRAISLWSSKMLLDDGLLVLIGNLSNLPASTYVKEFDFVTSTRITTTGETVFIFEKPHKWFGAIKKRQINASGFKDYQSLVNLISPRRVILDPFSNELRLRDAVVGSNRTYIGANAAAGTTEDMIASMECATCHR